MQETANYKLKKLELTDLADITELNSNADIVDAELKKHNNDIETIKNSYVTSFNGKTGAVVLPIATKQDAEAGVDDTKMMTSARVKEAVNKFAPLKTVNGQQPDEYGNVNVEEYTHPSSGVNAGTYDSVTVDKNGHVTAGSNPSRVTSVNGKTGAVTIATYTHPDSGATEGTYNLVTVNQQGHVTSGKKINKLDADGLLDLIYPVGSIYMSMNATNPETLFGGKWEAIAQGRCLIGAGTGTDSRKESKTFAAGDTGGEYNHQLTVGEMPSHSHSGQTSNANISGSVRYQSWGDGGFWSPSQSGVLSVGDAFTSAHSDSSGYDDGLYHSLKINSTHSHSITLSNTGGNNKYNIMQPYMGVYIWRRTA